MNTPWGPSQDINRVAEGITFVSTAGHGGLRLEKELIALLPPLALRTTFNRQGFAGWFEEDVDWAWVVLCLPWLFPEAQQEPARRTLECFHPDELKALRINSWFEPAEDTDGHWMILINGFQWGTGENPPDRSGAYPDTWPTQREAVQAYHRHNTTS